MLESLQSKVKNMEKVFFTQKNTCISYAFINSVFVFYLVKIGAITLLIFICWYMFKIKLNKFRLLHLFSDF